MKKSSALRWSALAPALLFFLAAEARGGSVTGRVLDASGKPVAGAKVQWTAYRSDAEVLLDETLGRDPAVLGETSADAEGRFRIVLDKPGVSVALRVQAQGHTPARFAGPFDSSEENALFDVPLTAAQPMSGKVVDEAGKPVGGARVFVVSTEGALEGDSRSIAVARAGADGAFAVPDAPEGARVVVARAPDFNPANRIQLEAKSEERISLQHGGSVRGLVTDTAGKPAAGVIVTTDDAAAQTGADGKFRLTGLPAGGIHLQALWKDDSAARKDGVRVRKGEEVEANLKLKPGAAISGTVIEEGSRRPVAGARVSAYAATRSGRFGRRRAERAARTDARGRFRLPGLAPARYGVEAVRDGYLTASIAGINAAAASVPAANLALRKAASISGRVTDEKGQAVGAARVRIMREMGIRRLLRGAASNPASILGGRGVLTAADGRFRIRGLEPERNLSLEATKTGYAAARKPGVSLRAGDAIKDVALVVRRGLEARGKVVDAKGQPVAGAEIHAIHREEGMTGAARVQMRVMGMVQDKPDAVTAGDGAYALKGLEEGEYTLTVYREGFARKSVPSVEVKANGENVWPPVTLTAGAPIAGAVHDAGGAPVAGAQIFGIDVGGGGGRPQNATSDAEGKFLLDGFVAERAIFLNVSAPGYATLQKSVTPPAEDLALVLKTAGTVRGRVEDSDTKKPITDFSISRSGPRGGGGIQFRIGRGEGDQTFQSDDGTFELTDVPPGKWTIRGTAGGYRSAEASGVEVGEGETKEGVVLSLKKGSGLSGRVTDPRGTAVANASVTWHPAETGGGPMGGAMARMMGGGGGSTTSDADGHFEFDGLPDSRITVTASHPDYLDASRDIDPSRETSVDLSLGTGASVAGTVVGSDGRSAVPGALVQLNEEGSSGGGLGGFGIGGDSTRTDASGNFLFEHLNGGRFKLIASGNTGKSAAKEVVVAENQRLDGVLVPIATGTTVHGTVSGLPQGQLGGVRIFASAKDYSDSAQTDDSGAYLLHDVPAGAVRLQATTSFLQGRSTGKTVEVPEGGDFQADIVFEGLSRLAGRVTRGDRPLSGLFVFASPDPPRGAAGRSSAQTDENGSYALEGLDDGNYQVVVTGQGVSYRRAIAVSGDTSGDIVLPSISLTGTVTESGSGDPLEGATVQAQTGQETQTGAMKQGVTDSSGHYFIDDVDSGAYQVTARKPGYQMKNQSVTVAADSAQADFALERGTGLGIRANDGLTGLPLRGVSVIAYGAGGSIAFSGAISLDSTGRGEIASLGPGAYALYIFSSGYSPRSFQSVIVPSATLGVVLTPGGRVEVRPAVPVTGRIVDASGAIYLLSPFRLDGSVHPSPPVTVWDNFTPGSYKLVVTGSSGEASYPFTVVEGRTTTVEVK